MRGSWSNAIILGGAFIFFVEGASMIFAACSLKSELALQAPLIYMIPRLLFKGLVFLSTKTIRKSVGHFCVVLTTATALKFLIYPAQLTNSIDIFITFTAKSITNYFGSYVKFSGKRFKVALRVAGYTVTTDFADLVGSEFCFAMFTTAFG